MTVTVEPGLYLRPGPGVPEALAGIGIRIEDDILITADGCAVYTTAPKTVADIEAVMRHESVAHSGNATAGGQRFLLRPGGPGGTFAVRAGGRGDSGIRSSTPESGRLTPHFDGARDGQRVIFERRQGGHGIPGARPLFPGIRLRARGPGIR